MNLRKKSRRIKKALIFLSLFLITASIFTFNHFHRKVLRQRLPKVAIVLDDWGYNLNNINLLRSIDMPITMAVLPNLKYSEEIAKESKFKNRQVILHMPMEPKGKSKRLEKDTLLAAMNEQEIASIFDRALNTVHAAIGVSNHMGSKFTADSNGMTVFLKLLKKKGLFFMDNVSTHNPVCDKIAPRFKVKFVERDIFLDNFNKIDYIKGQLYKLAAIAEKRGYAAGTGHDREKTLLAIKELVPKLKDKVNFVFVSELAK